MAKKGPGTSGAAGAGAPDQSTVVEPLPQAASSQRVTEPEGTLVTRLADGAPPAQSPAAQSPAAQSPAAQSPAAQSPAAQSPTGSPDPATSSAGPLGLDVVMRWDGEMHKAAFFARPQLITIGEGGQFELPDDVMGGKQLDTLVQPDPQHQFALSLGNTAMTGQVIVGSEVYAIGDIRNGRTPLPKDCVPITAKTHAFLEFGQFTFVLSRGAVPPPAKPNLWDKEDTLLFGAFALALLLLLGPVVASFQLAPPRRSGPYNPYEDDLANKTIEIEVVEEKKEEPPKEEEAAQQKEEPKNEQAVQAPPQAEQQKQADKQAREIEKALEAAPPEEREAKKQQLVAAEVNKATADIDAALANVPTTKLAGLAEAGEVAAGSGGPVLVLNTGDGPDLNAGRKAGSGVGGASDTGKQVAAGLGKQATDGSGPKLNTEVKAKEQKVIRLGGQQSADGELPPDVIKKVLADKSGALKACYQKELQGNPDLAGSIKVKFMISPNGAVAGAKIESSSIGNDKVEGCITTIIKSLRFPQAKGGGVTTVNKTFTFKSS